MNDSPLALSGWLALVAAIRFYPLDDTPRLVAADWLQETECDELCAWADFIRLQVEGSLTPRTDHVYTECCDCGACRTERRATAIQDRWGMFWNSHAFRAVFEWSNGFRAKAIRWERGFPSDLIADYEPWKPKELPKLAQSIFERVPIPRAELRLRDVFQGNMRTEFTLFMSFGRSSPDAVVNRFQARAKGASISSRAVSQETSVAQAIGDAVADVILRS